MGWSIGNNTVVTDRSSRGYSLPTLDRVQNLVGISGKVDDDQDRQILMFSRKIDTGDADEDIPLTSCVYFMFPIGGGRIMAKSETDLRNPNTPLGIHDLKTPKISPTPICFCEG